MLIWIQRVYYSLIQRMRCPFILLLPYRSNRIDTCTVFFRHIVNFSITKSSVEHMWLKTQLLCFLNRTFELHTKFNFFSSYLPATRNLSINSNVNIQTVFAFFFLGLIYISLQYFPMHLSKIACTDVVGEQEGSRLPENFNFMNLYSKITEKQAPDPLSPAETQILLPSLLPGKKSGSVNEKYI